MDTTQQAFVTICREAQPPKGCFVSLYLAHQYYGGPEEGGWWGWDHKLIASQDFPTMEQAEDAKAQDKRGRD